VVAGALGVLALPLSLNAQDLGFLQGFFGKAHTLALYVGTAGLKSKDVITTRNSGCLSGELCGAGVELLLDLSSPAASQTHVELGFSANYLRGFEATDKAIAIRGSLRSFPIISAYVTNFSLGEWLAPYIGLSFGLSDLWNARIYGADSIPVSLKGSTFEYGPTLGTQIGTAAWGNLFIEGGFRFRRYGGLEYGDPKSPHIKQFPRDLDASGFFMNAGFAFSLRDPEKQPPSYPGTWVLTRANGMTLPATLTQTRRTDSAQFSRRVELVRGALELETNPQCFLAVLQKRELQFSGQVQVDVVISRPDSVRGRWTESSEGVLELRLASACPGPAGATESIRRILRENDEIVWSDNQQTGATLHFNKVKN
jgi:hypothetical protein